VSFRRYNLYINYSFLNIYFTYLARSPPWTDFYHTWNERSPREMEVKVPIFPIGIWRRRYNSAALPCTVHSLW